MPTLGVQLDIESRSIHGIAKCREEARNVAFAFAAPTRPCPSLLAASGQIVANSSIKIAPMKHVDLFDDFLGYRQPESDAARRTR